jgi:predicted phosphodiesterase
VHLSDTHVAEGSNINETKIKKMIEAINSARDFSECVIVISGDLTNVGKTNEYKLMERLLGKLVNGIVDELGKKDIRILVVPGNHDLDLSKLTRDGRTIQGYYNSGNIADYISNELLALNNFYEFSWKNGLFKENKFIDRQVIAFDGYKIQFNLLNTALFSTKKPDDKELHYFPQNELQLLDKQNEEINLVITIMHHSVEWFRWEYKNALERKIHQSSSILMTGHDHLMYTKEVDMNNSGDTIVSVGGIIDFSDISSATTFSSIKIDTEKNIYWRYLYTWNPENELFQHKMIIENGYIAMKAVKLNPTQKFLSEFKEDSRCNFTKEFTQYFVFPKMTGKDENDYQDDCEILDYCTSTKN